MKELKKEWYQQPIFGYLNKIKISLYKKSLNRNDMMVDKQMTI